MIRRLQWARLLLLFFPVLSVGCTKYRPVPLEPDREWSRIEGLRLEDLAKGPDDSKDPSDTQTPPFDYSDGLSIGEAAGLAVALNPEIRAFRLERGIAEGQLIEAGLLPNPEISDSKWTTPIHAAASWAGEVNAALDLAEALLMRGPRKAGARMRVEEVRWEIAEREWRLANEARLAYTDVLYVEETIRLNAKQREIADKTLALIAARRARGAASDLEVLVAETEQVNLIRQERSLTGVKRGALQRLNRQLGLPPNHSTRLQVPEKPLAYEAYGGNAEELADLLRSTRPSVLAAERAYLVAERELQAACRKQFPRMLLGPSYEGGDGEKNGRMGVFFSLELPLFDRNQGEIAVKTAEREQRRRQYESELQEARAELYSSWNRLETIDSELKVFFADAAPRLDRSLELTRVAFEKGEVDLLQVLLVQERVLRIQREILEALRDLHRVKIEVERSVGPRGQSATKAIGLGAP